MKNSKKNLVVIILLVVVIIILLGAIGYPYLKTTQPASNQQTTSDLLKLYGKTDAGDSFSIEYPVSWIYYKFSCNADGIAFWPKGIAPDLSQDGACGINSFLESAPIVLSTVQDVKLNLKDTSYQSVFDQMKSSLK